MIRTLDLFCGAGGSSWGAAAAGAEITGGVDAWDLAVSTFAANFPHARAVTARLHPRFQVSRLANDGQVDLLLASPECTNHTCARGSRPRDEESRETARYVLSFARSLRPRWVVIENVIQMRTWPGYEGLLEALRTEYFVSTQVLDAADFGVPQTRRRLFVLCDRDQPPPIIEPAAGLTPLPARTVLDPAGTWSVGPLYRPGRARPTLERAERAISSLGPGEPFLIVYYGSDGGGGWQTLNRPLRTMTTLDRFGLVQWHRGEPTLRMLQVPELLRAMGFDNRFQLPSGSRRDRIKLLGNGVAPPVMRAIVGALCSAARRSGRRSRSDWHASQRLGT